MSMYRFKSVVWTGLAVVLFAQDSWFLLLKKLELVSFRLHLSQMPFITFYHILAENKVNILHECFFLQDSMQLF